MDNVVDMRSDTVTRPCEGMREAMHRAKVGDDVLEMIPASTRCRHRPQPCLAKKLRSLCPRGPWPIRCAFALIQNLAMRSLWSRPHIFSCMKAVASRPCLACRALCAAPLGLLGPEHVRAAVRAPGSRSHYPVSKLLCVENTANRSGGTVYDVAKLDALEAVAREHGLRTHLDGARVMNAAVALGVPVSHIAAQFDSISFCLSKGLGCPVGSLIVGSQAFVDRAHRFRKMFGGGMRQSGILAAAGLYALEHNINRLAKDHERARQWAEAALAIEGVDVNMETVQSNMVYVDVSGTGQEAATVAQRLHDAGVWMSAVSTTSLRAVFHLDIDDQRWRAALRPLRRP